MPLGHLCPRRNASLGLLLIFWLDCLGFFCCCYWAAWAIIRFWRWIPSQLLGLQIFMWNLEKWYSSVHSVVSDSLRPHERQHTRPPCVSPTPGVHPNPCPLSQWCHPSVSSCCPLLLLPSIFPSIRGSFFFKWVSSLHEVAKVLELQLQHQSFQWTPRTVSFRMDWLDLLAVQGTLKSLLQHHSSKASILRHSAFFIVQLSHPYMITGNTIALTRWTFVGKVMSLLFKMLSRLVITFLPRGKRLLISWLQSPSAVILEPRKIKSAAVSQSICHEVILSLSSRGSLGLLHFLP